MTADEARVPAWKLVPVEPTEEMHSAIRFALENWRGQDKEKTADPRLKAQLRWDAALAAAPPPPPFEPVYKAVERVLDENSAWIARPDAEVTKRVAFAAFTACYIAMEKIAAAPPPPVVSEITGDVVRRVLLAHADLDSTKRFTTPIEEYYEAIASAASGRAG